MAKKSKIAKRKARSLRMPDLRRDAQARVVLSKLAARTGRHTEAGDQFRGGLAIAQRLGAHPSNHHIRSSLAELERVREGHSFKPLIGHRGETFSMEPKVNSA